MRDTGTTPETEFGKISVVGNYLPRLCGIATFTTHLTEAIASAAPNTVCTTMAMNDKPVGYDYPERVRYEINQEELKDYRKAADFLNVNKTEVVSIQHEYGIYGGAAGQYILELLENLHMPVVTTLHTVLTHPSDAHHQALARLSERSDRLVVMSRSAADILNSVYDVPKEKIAYIPHGIPDMPFIDPDYHKRQFDLLDRKVLLTFGLLSRNKGIEYVIKALQQVVKHHPDVMYVVLGKTHPHVLESEGESYRESLMERVRKENLEENVQFQNQFVSQEELCDYLAAADLYVTPYVEEDQITSGTLAYAMGTGKAVISTPYWYAQEMLADGRGELVPFRDSEIMAESINHLLTNHAERSRMRIQAYDFSRSSVWEEVARQYLDLFQEVREERLHGKTIPVSTGRSEFPTPTETVSTGIHLPQNRKDLNSDVRTEKAGAESPVRNHNYSARRNGQSKPTLKTLKLPPVKLDHLIRLSDSTGILQHASYTVGNRNFGYCTDDNARALIAIAQVLRQTEITSRGNENLRYLEDLYHSYLSFVVHAFDPETGRFHNFMSYDRQWLEREGSRDSHGRALWSLGQVISEVQNHEQLQLASTFFKQSVSAANTFESPRSIAFSLIGMNEYLEIYSGDSEVKRSFSELAERLYRQFRKNEKEDWPWPEDILTYANARLPQALLIAGERLRRDDLLQTGLKSLEWLMEIQTQQGHLTPVGNLGWYRRGEQMARFDQQPIEANALIEAGIVALEVSQKPEWMSRIATCFHWFTGYNDLRITLYDRETGGCRDGLESDGVNQNQGAESTLAWLLSLIKMHQLSGEKRLAARGNVKISKVMES